MNYKPLDVNLALPEYLHVGPLPTPTYMPTILPPVKPLIIQHSYDAPSGMVFDGESHNKNEIKLTRLIKFESLGKISITQESHSFHDKVIRHFRIFGGRGVTSSY